MFMAKLQLMVPTYVVPRANIRSQVDQFVQKWGPVILYGIHEGCHSRRLGTKIKPCWFDIASHGSTINPIWYVAHRRRPPRTKLIFHYDDDMSVNVWYITFIGIIYAIKYGLQSGLWSLVLTSNIAFWKIFKCMLWNGN